MCQSEDILQDSVLSLSHSSRQAWHQIPLSTDPFYWAPWGFQFFVLSKNLVTITLWHHFDLKTWHEPSLRFTNSPHTHTHYQLSTWHLISPKTRNYNVPNSDTDVDRCYANTLVVFWNYVSLHSSGWLRSLFGAGLSRVCRPTPPHWAFDFLVIMLFLMKLNLFFFLFNSVEGLFPSFLHWQTVTYFDSF